MQSSAGMVFRAIVMLACLVAVPLAALFGSSLPDLAREMLGERLGLVRFGASPPLVGAAPGNMPIQASAPSAVGQGAMAGSWGANNLPFAQTWPGSAPTGQQNSPNGGAMWPANHGPPEGFREGAAIPVGSTVGADALHASFEAPVGKPLGFLQWPDERPSGFRSDVASVDNPRKDVSPVLSAAELAGSVDRFSLIQRQFRELGSVYTLLETWGDQGQLYRFYCRMAIGGNPNYTRYFEATDSEPLAAMARVLEQVEVWRSSGQP